MDDETLKTHILQRFTTAFEFNTWLVKHLWPAYRERRMARHARRKPAEKLCPYRCGLDGRLLTASQARSLEAGEGVRSRFTGEAYRMVNGVRILLDKKQ